MIIVPFLLPIPPPLLPWNIQEELWEQSRVEEEEDGLQLPLLIISIGNSTTCSISPP